MAEEENKEAEGEEIVVKKSGNSQVMIMMVLCIAVILLTPFAVIYTLRVLMALNRQMSVLQLKLKNTKK